MPRIRNRKRSANRKRLRREHRQGVRLAAACRSYNGAFNQTVYGTRDAEVPF